MLTNKELTKIRKALPTGSYENIATKIGVSVATVKSSFYYEDRFNHKVIEEALNIIDREKEKIYALKTKIKAIK